MHGVVVNEDIVKNLQGFVINYNKKIIVVTPDTCSIDNTEYLSIIRLGHEMKKKNKN